MSIVRISWILTGTGNSRICMNFKNCETPHPSPFVHEPGGGVRQKNSGLEGIHKFLVRGGTPTPSL